MFTLFKIACTDWLEKVIVDPVCEVFADGVNARCEIGPIVSDAKMLGIPQMAIAHEASNPSLLISYSAKHDIIR